MTVQELIDALKEMPQEKFIRIEVVHQTHRRVRHHYVSNVETIECDGANVKLTGWISDYD